MPATPNTKTPKSYRLSDATVDAIKELAAQRGCSDAEVIAIAIDRMTREETQVMYTGHRMHLILPTDSDQYQVQPNTGDPVDLQEWVFEMRQGAEVYVLGKDELPEDVEDIRGLIRNQPDVVIAIAGHDPVGAPVHYWGANKITNGLDYLFK